MAAPRIRLGLSAPAHPPVGETSQFVYLSRAVGLEGVVLWDHLQGFVPSHLWDEGFSWAAKDQPNPNASFDYRVLLGQIASRAGRLRIGVGVTEPVRHHPVSIAQTMSTLSHMTRRRPILGIGAGERMNIEPYGLEFNQLATRVEEALQIIHLCFEDRESIDFEGKIFQLRGARMGLRPKPGNRPDIWVAAHGPRMLRITGRYADGWFPGHAATPDGYAESLRVVRAAAEEAGRDPDEITPALYASVFIASTDEEARRLLDTPMGRYTALSETSALWARHGRKHPLGDDFRGFVDILAADYDRKVLDDALSSITLDMMLDSAYVGSPETLARRFREFGEVGLRYLSILPLSAAITRRNLLYLPRGLWRLRRLLK